MIVRATVVVIPMVAPSSVAWAHYNGYEGPFFRGVKPYTLPQNPTEDDRVLAVIAAVEGRLDAINMYDRCIVSTSMMQLCEAGFYGTSTLLGQVADKLGEAAVIGPLGPALAASNAVFRKNEQGHWRFAFLDDRGEVNSLAKQRELFLKCSGLKGAWTDPAWKDHAKLWAACLASVWEDDRACRVQIDHVKQRLRGFIFAAARAVLFDDPEQSPWARALRAIYLSFAVNNPTIANAQFKAAVAELKSPKWSEPWCTGILQKLVFGAGVAIYLIRYNSTKPVVEKLWGIKLPDAPALRAWVEPDPEPPPSPLGDTPAPSEAEAEVVNPVSNESVEQPPEETKQVVIIEQPPSKQASAWVTLIAWFTSLLAAIFRRKK